MEEKHFSCAIMYCINQVLFVFITIFIYQANVGFYAVTFETSTSLVIFLIEKAS